ncbi:unnamed protein product [Merluccius merluccius]
MRDELAELKADIDQKFDKISTEVGEQDEKINAALTRTEEIESWSHEANSAMQEILQEQKILVDKLDNLESSGVKTYGSAAEAANDLRGRGYDVDNTGTSSGGATLVERLQSTGTATWKQTGSRRTAEASKRARGRLEVFQLRGNNTG